MSFNGTTQLFTINDSNSLDITNCSFYIVLKRNGNGTGNEFVLAKNPNNSSDAPVYYHLAKVGGSNSKFIVYTSNGYASNVDTQIDLGDGVPRIMSFIYNGTTNDSYVNGIKTNSTGGYGNIITSTGSLQIGGSDQSLSGAQWYFNGYISELIIFNRALNTTEHLSVTNYLNDKYALYTSATIIRNGKLRIKTPPPFPTNGLLAFWRLNNADGLSTISSDFGSYTLQVGGYGYQSAVGKINNCFYFADSSKGLFTNQQILNQTNNPQSFSCAFWINVPDGYTPFVILGNAFGSLGFYFENIAPDDPYERLVGIMFAIGTGNENNGNSWQTVQQNSTLNSNTWYHVVGTYNKDAEQMYLYINGQLIGSTDGVVSSGNEHPDWNGFALNGSVRYNDKEYGGNQYLDAVGIWNKTLTPTEVAQLYNGGNGLEY